MINCDMSMKAIIVDRVEQDGEAIIMICQQGSLICIRYKLEWFCDSTVTIPLHKTMPN